MRINGITYGKLKTQLQVNGNLNAYARVTLVRGNFGKCLDCGAGGGRGVWRVIWVKIKHQIMLFKCLKLNASSNLVQLQK